MWFLLKCTEIQYTVYAELPLFIAKMKYKSPSSSLIPAATWPGFDFSNSERSRRSSRVVVASSLLPKGIENLISCTTPLQSSKLYCEQFMITGLEKLTRFRSCTKKLISNDHYQWELQPHTSYRQTGSTEGNASSSVSKAGIINSLLIHCGNNVMLLFQQIYLKYWIPSADWWEF